jgi:acetyl esterase/lipase
MSYLYLLNVDEFTNNKSVTDLVMGDSAGGNLVFSLLLHVTTVNSVRSLFNIECRLGLLD